MSYSYEYDKSGLASSYLALSFLVPITLTYLYFLFSRKQQKPLECKICPKKRQNSFFLGFILFILLCLVSYFINNIRTIKMEFKKDFDPLEILGVSIDASKKTIKKKMQTLLMKYSVQKAPDDKKKEFEKKSMDISKAYVIMKNKDSFNSWLNTESKSGEIMAIPEIIMKNAFIAFLIYCLILIIALPLYTFRKWNIMKNRNRLSIHFKSMEEFIKYFNEDLRKRGDVRSLIWILSKSVEFISNSAYKTSKFQDKDVYKQLPAYSKKDQIFIILKDKIGENFGYPLSDLKSNGSYFFYDFLFRTNLTNSYEKRIIIKNSLNLVECMKLIALNKGYIDLLKDIFTLQGMITQAVFDEEYYLLQFPFVEFKNLFLLKIKKGNKLQTSEALKCLLDNLKLEEAEKLFKAIPKVEIKEFIATVKGNDINNDTYSISDVKEDVNNKDSISDVNNKDSISDVNNKDSISDVNNKGVKEDFSNKSTLNSSNSIVNTFDIPKNSLVTIKIRLNTTNSRVGVHTHFIDIPLEHSWTAFISIDNNLHKKFTKINKSQEEITFEFEAFKNKKVSEVKLFLLDGFYLRNSVEESILIKYV